MEARSAIVGLVGAAHRRALWLLVWDQATVGAIAALAGSIVLLLAGTQILEWYWLILLFAGGMTIGVWRAVRRLPSHYEVAQLLDRRFTLHDTLSTAFHFLGAPPGRLTPPEVVESQRAQAARIAASVDAATGVPWRAPRLAIPALALAGIAATLFGVRYGLQGSLDLRAPIVQAVADFFAPGHKVQAQVKKPPRVPGEDPLGISVDRPDGKNADLDAAPEDVLAEVNTPDVNAAVDFSSNEKARRSEIKAAGDQSEGLDEGAEEGERGAADQGKEGAAGSRGSEPDALPRNADNAKQGNSPEHASLLNKMRDAMANLLSKMKLPNPGGDNRQMASRKEQGGMREPGGGQKGEKGQGQPQGKGSPSDDPDAEGQPGDQQAQAGEGRSNDKGQEGGSPNESKSGMGKQDGNKELRDAEQLAAMGKISEIFGKRAQNMTGEVMVEVSSSKQQQLRTAYSKRSASHREAGAEIHRDEIPQDLQHFVQQYFEHVRKGEKTPNQ